MLTFSQPPLDPSLDPDWMSQVAFDFLDTPLGTFHDMNSQPTFDAFVGMHNTANFSGDSSFLFMSTQSKIIASLFVALPHAHITQTNLTAPNIPMPAGTSDSLLHFPSSQSEIVASPFMALPHAHVTQTNSAVPACQNS
jgi:hypothetical protein